jgi:hypothetical protein
VPPDRIFRLAAGMIEEIAVTPAQKSVGWVSEA